MRICSLFVRHGTDRYPDSLDLLRDLFRRQLPAVRHDIVVIDNALNPNHFETAPHGTVLIGGDNAVREFTAWDRGHAYIHPSCSDYDLIHLVTETFNTLYTRYLERIDAISLEAIVDRATALGLIDSLDEPVVLFNRVSQSWIRTSFVFMPAAELDLLGRVTTLTSGEHLFSGDPSDPFRRDAPLSAWYRTHIIDWLTGPETGDRVWHSRFDLTSETLGTFEAKTLAILNEHLLSIRLRTQGCACVDAMWLAAHARERRDQGPAALQGWPDWRHQLAHRDVDAAPHLDVA